MSIVYRPEIDGLRTISVMLVIFNHLGWSLFSGGFVGVDVFFVISGFLITSGVYRDIERGEFSLSSFYKRRVLRLAPAYFIVLSAVTVVSLILMIPDELLNYFKSVIYSTFFLVNFYLSQNSGGYFAINADTIPLLHLWSLSVEEQFYVFWPLMLLFVHKKVPTKFLLFVVAVALVIGIAISGIQIHFDPEKAYYLMPTRFFELLIGAILVFLPNFACRSIHKSLLSIFGLCLIFLSAIFYTKDTYFPGVTALLPCSGAALVLLFSNNRSGCGILLSSAPMVHLGKLSYPAYLWHWPMIAFLNLCAVAIDWKIGIAVIVVTFILSQFTYVYLEKPAQKLKKIRDIKVFSYGYFLPAAIFLCLAAAVQIGHGWIQRFPIIEQKQILALDSFAHILRKPCHDSPPSSPQSSDKCILGVNNRSVDFLLVGDSHANSETGMIDTMARNADLRGYDITQNSTLFLPNTKFFRESKNGIAYEAKDFLQRNNVLINIIKNNHYKAVILGGYFSEAYNNGDYRYPNSALSSSQVVESALEKAIEIIQKAGSRPIIINDTPRLGSVEAACILNNERFGRSDNCSINLAENIKFTQKWNKFLSKLIQKYPDLLVIDPTKVTCDKEQCFSQIDNIPLYRNHDSHHLNMIGSELIGQQYISRFGNPLLAIKR